MNNGINPVEQFSSSEISKVLARYRSSGLGAKRFAQEHGIPPGRLHYWVYQKGRTKARKLSTLVRLASKPAFQEVTVTTLGPATVNWVAEVSLPQGPALRFSAAASPTWIASVVQALQRPC
jgi:hypothetical protein